MVKKNKDITSYRDFWPFYVSQHMNKTNRWLHFTGTTGVLLLAGLLALRLIALLLGVELVLPGAWYVWLGHPLLLPISGYGFAWFGHAFFEKNRPATFSYPAWSLVGDFQMYWSVLRGTMDAEVEKVRNSTAQ